MKKLILFSFCLATLFSCGGEKPKEEATEKKVEKAVEVETVDHIMLKGNDDMTYDKTKFTVKAGKEIILTFSNAGTMPIEAMGHNVVVLHLNVDVDAFVNEAIIATDNDYIPKSKEADIIAHTRTLGPKQGQQIKFTLDQPGEYDFVCTFPGHAMTMKGKITAI